MVDREALNPKGVKMWCSSCRISSCSHSDLGSDLIFHMLAMKEEVDWEIEVRGFCRTQQKIPMNREVLYLWLVCRPGGAVQARQGRKVVQVAREGVSELGSLQICTSSSIGLCCCCTWCTSTTWSTPILRLGDGELTTTKSKVCHPCGISCSSMQTFKWSVISCPLTLTPLQYRQRRVGGSVSSTDSQIIRETFDQIHSCTYLWWQKERVSF